MFEWRDAFSLGLYGMDLHLYHGMIWGIDGNGIISRYVHFIFFYLYRNASEGVSANQRSLPEWHNITANQCSLPEWHNITANQCSLPTVKSESHQEEKGIVAVFGLVELYIYII